MSFGGNSSSLWQKIIKENTISSISEEFENVNEEMNVVFFGNVNSGKKNLIRFLQGDKISRELEDVTDRGSESFGLNYSYMRRNSGELLNLYEIENFQFTNLLDLILKSDIETISRSVFLVTLDVNKISTIEEDLILWLSKISQYMTKMFKKMPSEDVRGLMKNNENKYQNMKRQDGLQVNLGIPVISVVCKSENVWKVAETHHQQKYSFDFMNPEDISHYFLTFLQYRLRKICVKYGACLLYTSSDSDFTNCQLLEHLIISILFSDSDCYYPTERKRMEAIYIPFGYDSDMTIVNELGDDVRTITENPETTTLQSVIKTSHQQAKHYTLPSSSKAGLGSWQNFLKKQRTMLKFEKSTKNRIIPGRIDIPKKSGLRVSILTPTEGRMMTGSKMSEEFNKKKAKMMRMSSRGGGLTKLSKALKRNSVLGGHENMGGLRKKMNRGRAQLLRDFKNFSAKMSSKTSSDKSRVFASEKKKTNHYVGFGLPVSSTSSTIENSGGVGPKSDSRAAMEDFFTVMLRKLKE